MVAKDYKLARKEFVEMIEKSWTWARLNDEEQGRFLALLRKVETRGDLKGTYKERFSICHVIYEGFLEGLGYKPIGWRE